MRDSRLGTFGAAALLVALVLQVVAGGRLGSAALPWFVFAHGASRAVSSLVMATTRPARADGLGARSLPGLSPWWIAASTTVVAVVGVALLPNVGAVAHLAAWGVAGAAAVGLRAWALRAVDGITGDVLGAVQVAALVGILLVGTGVVG